MSLAENLKLIHTVESRDDKEYQAFKSVSKELNKLKTSIGLYKLEHMDAISRVEFWSDVEFWVGVENTLRQCAKKLEKSHSPTDDEMLEMAKEDRPISREEIGLQIHPPRVLME